LVSRTNVIASNGRQIEKKSSSSGMITGSRKNVKKQNEMVAEKDLPSGVS